MYNSQRLATLGQISMAIFVEKCSHSILIVFLYSLQETTLYGCTVRINEPVGVVGIACPDQFPLLAFVSLFAPAVVRGNTIVIVPSQQAPLSATDLYQVGERERERERRRRRREQGNCINFTDTHKE